MANGKTVSVSDDLARMLDEEVRHILETSGVEVSRASIVAGILKPALKARHSERHSIREPEAPKRGKKA